MKKTLLLFLFLASMKVFSATPGIVTPSATIPNYDSKTHIVFIPKAIVIGTDGISVMYENIELLLNPRSTWVILKADLLDIEFTDADTLTIPDFDLSTRTIYFPKVTVDNNNESTADLLLAISARWELLSFEPIVAPLVAK